MSTANTLQCQFPTQKYSQTPRRNTTVGTGRGTAAVRVEQAQRRRQVGGKGSTPAGAGNTFLKGATPLGADPHKFAGGPPRWKPV